MGLLLIDSLIQGNFWSGEIAGMANRSAFISHVSCPLVIRELRINVNQKHLVRLPSRRLVICLLQNDPKHLSPLKPMRNTCQNRVIGMAQRMLCLSPLAYPKGVSGPISGVNG